MAIVRWDSSRDVAALQERMNRMLEGFYVRPQEDLTRGAWVPAVDIYSNGQHELVLKAELPDMKEEEFAVTVEDNTLTLRGEKKLTRRSLRSSSIASNAVMVRSHGRSCCRRRSTLARSAPSTRPHADGPTAVARRSQAQADQGRSRRCRVSHCGEAGWLPASGEGRRKCGGCSVRVTGGHFADPSRIGCAPS